MDTVAPIERSRSRSRSHGRVQDLELLFQDLSIRVSRRARSRTPRRCRSPNAVVQWVQHDPPASIHQWGCWHGRWWLYKSETNEWSTIWKSFDEAGHIVSCEWLTLREWRWWQNWSFFENRWWQWDHDLQDWFTVWHWYDTNQDTWISWTDWGRQE